MRQNLLFTIGVVALLGAGALVSMQDPPKPVPVHWVTVAFDADNCDTDGFDVSWRTDYSSGVGGYVVTGVQLTRVSWFCKKQDITVYLNSSSASDATGAAVLAWAVVAGDPTVSSSPLDQGVFFDFSDAHVAARAINGIAVTVPDALGFTAALAPSALTLRRSAGIATFGRAVTLTARLAPPGAATGSGLPGRTVTIERSTGTGWVRIVSLVTGVDGTAATTVRPVRNADYRVLFAGDGAYDASTSTASRVNIRYAVTLKPKVGRAPVTIGRTGFVDLVATVRPEPTAGTGPSPASVTRPRVAFDLLRRVGGRWSLLTRTVVSANAQGVATWRFRPPASGTWAVRAAARASSSNFESVFTPLVQIVVR